jgi:hypothetical protein
MRRSMIAVVAGFCLVAGTPADARPKHPSHSPAIHRSYAWIHTKQGSSRVIAWARPRFQGFINEVERSGYRVGAPGCLSSGHMRHSKHHWGGACDLFVQVARNRTRLRLPPNHMAIALRYGLIDGCVWRNPDCGHFEVPDGQTVAQTMARRAYGRRARRYASR